MDTTRTARAALAIALLASAAIAGCTPSHKDEKNAAEGRWSEARSGILYSLARQQLAVGDLDKAEGTCLQALEMRPEEASLHALAARISLERGELERAYHRLERAIGFDEERAESHYLMGVILQRWQRYEPALASYDRARELAPAEVSGLLAAAEMLVQLDRADEATELLERRADYFEHNAALRVALGRIHLLRGDAREATRRLRQASLLAPEDPSILEHRALAEFAAGDYEEASHHLRNLLGREDYADRDDLRDALGDSYMALGRPNAARDAYREITSRTESNADAWIKMGQAAWMAGDHHRVGEAARHALSLAPRRHEGYVLRGLAESRAGRHDQAIAQFDRAAGLAPASALPWIMKGMTLEQSGDQDGAARAYQHALEIDPDDPRPRQLLAALDD